MSETEVRPPVAIGTPLPEEDADETFLNLDGPLLSPTDLPPEMPILPRTRPSGYGDLSLRLDPEDREPSMPSEEEVAEARAFLESLGLPAEARD